MAERKDSEVLDIAESTSNETTSNAGCSAEHKEPIENSTHQETQEPSEDDPLFKREKIRRPFKTYKAITVQHSSTDIYANYDEPSNDGENKDYRIQCREICIDLFDLYNNCAIKFRNSKFIYIVQILSTLLPISALVMGKIYADVCPGSPSLAGLTLLTAIWSLFLIAMWIAIVYCHSEDRPCEGQQKLLILIFFLSVVALLEIEIYQFSMVSPYVDPSASNYCNRVFYDYTRFKFIAAFLSMFLVVLLYLPGCSNFASGLTCAGPDRCYQEALEENE